MCKNGYNLHTEGTTCNSSVSEVEIGGETEFEMNLDYKVSINPARGTYSNTVSKKCL